MPKHRGLTMSKFLKTVGPELLDQYFVNLVGEGRLPKRVFMNDELVQQFLDAPENSETRGMVLEDFHRVNDLAKVAKSTLIWAYRRYDLEWQKDEPPESMAMRLFLEHPNAFKHAYVLYTWHNSASRMSEYDLPASRFELTEERLHGFQDSIANWFSHLAKGDTTAVNCYEQDDATVILVTHGSYVRTVAAWEGEEVTIRSFRPATEDILLYDPLEGVLRIKATLEKDRKHYLASFAGHVLEDAGLAEQAQENPMYTLEPFQTGRFGFTGNSSIASIVLLEAKLELGDDTEARAHLKSKDLQRSLSGTLSKFSLRMGDLTYVKLRFFLEIEGEESHETVEIAPPERSDLPGIKHEEVISAYLRQQGVKLI